MKSKLIDKLLDSHTAACLVWAQKHYRTRAGTVLRVACAAGITPAQLHSEYLMAIAEHAERKMGSEFALRKNWAHRMRHCTLERAWIESVPLYARHAVFGAQMPEALAAKYAKLAGTLTDTDIVERAAYRVCDWGRKRNTARGANLPERFSSGRAPGYRAQENGRYKGQFNRIIYSYHADYAAVTSGRLIWVALPDGRNGEGRRTALGSWSVPALGLRSIARMPMGTPRLTEAQQVRVLRRALLQAGRTDLIAEWDDGRLAVIEPATGEIYHTSAGATLRGLAAAAIAALQKRAIQRRQVARNAELDALIAQRGSTIYVGVADSINSGNCESGTRLAIPTIVAALHADGEVGAVTVAHLLSVRDDSYTRRAARVAALRYLAE